MKRLIEGDIKMLITDSKSILKVMDDIVVIDYDLPIES